MAAIDHMKGYQFEKFMQGVYQNMGYHVQHTPISGDQGADLILTDKNGQRIAIQVKRYSGKVSNKAIQEVVAAKAMYRCSEGVVVTNSWFTQSAKQLASVNGIGLVDRNGLRKLLLETEENAE